MNVKWIAAAAAIAAMALTPYTAFAQWDEDEEQQRLEDQQRDEVLYQDSDAGVHDESIHMPRKKQPPPPPEPDTDRTPAEEIEGPSSE
ncbi:MAG: hypothetical protein JXA24_01020 [Proteobacteria bacterium]|nr:hypothetical protein [Pseudomonadota bacterium]